MNQRKVLFVSPRFPPVNAPDHFRVRTALPYLREYGWSPHILCIDDAHVDRVKEPLLIHTYPEDVPVTMVTPFRRSPVVNGIELRCVLPLYKEGCRLLQSETFDLVYFSSTVFPTFPLGRLWRRKYHTPYILDFQDPWLNDYYKDHNAPPPGGALRYNVARLQARLLEPWSLKQSSHCTVVSPAYVQMLTQRYSFLSESHFSVLPFGAPLHDLKVLDTHQTSQSIIRADDQLFHWVYVGRAATDMEPSLRVLFGAVRAGRKDNASTWSNIRLHFVGSSYAANAGKGIISRLADEYGVSDITSEHPQRIPYFQALRLMKDATGILIIGSNDPGYNPSKALLSIAVGKPLCAILNPTSLATDLIKTLKGGLVIQNEGTGADEQRQLQQLLVNPTPSDTDWEKFDHHSAKSSTAKLCKIFDSCIN